MKVTTNPPVLRDQPKMKILVSLISVYESPAESMARKFHDLYEEMAPDYGYETRPESRKPWDEVPEKNRRLMIAVCGRILTEGF